jgi:peptidoglycan/LPS O-acetylase OafA/YrhL
MYLFGPIGQEIAVYLFRDILTAVPIHLLILTAVAITFCIAAAVYKYVEKPSIALARRLIHMLDLKYSKAQ